MRENVSTLNVEILMQAVGGPLRNDPTAHFFINFELQYGSFKVCKLTSDVLSPIINKSYECHMKYKIGGVKNSKND